MLNYLKKTGINFYLKLIKFQKKCFGSVETKIYLKIEIHRVAIKPGNLEFDNLGKKTGILYKNHGKTLNFFI